MRPPFHPFRGLWRCPGGWKRSQEDTTLEFLILCHVAAGEDSVQQEGHRPDPDGGAPAGHAGHQPPRQVQAVGKGDPNLVPGYTYI